MIPLAQILISSLVFLGLILGGFGIKQVAENGNLNLGISTYVVTQGGTGTTTVSSGAVLYGQGTSAFRSTGPCSDGQVLGWSSNVPICDTDDSGGGGSGGSNWQFSGGNAITPTTTVGIIINNASSSIVGLSMLRSTTTQSTTTNLDVVTQLKVETLTSALTLTGATGVFAEYTGVTCTNQFIRVLDALGAGTCATVGTADVSGLDISADTNLAATWPVILTDDTLSFGGLSTSTAAVIGNIPYFSGVNTFANVATGTVSESGLIGVTAGQSIIGSGLTISLDNIGANTVIGNNTGASAAPVAFSTTTLFAGGTAGYVLGWDGNTWEPTATATCAAITGSAGLCDGSDDGGGGTSSKWATSTGSTVGIIPNGGNNVALGIGTTTPFAALQVGSTTGRNIVISDTDASDNLKHWYASSWDGVFSIGTTTDSYSTTSPPAFQINPTGVGVFIGATSSNNTVTGLAVEGTVVLGSITQATGGTNNDVCITGTTNNLVEETTGVCVVSSRKFKHDIKTLNFSGLDLVMKLNPVSFSPNDDDVADFNNTHYGLIAEEVADVDPHFARYGIDGSPRTLDDWAILAASIKAIQEQQKQIDELKLEVNLLRSNQLQCKL